jgi:hypothetical protein
MNDINKDLFIKLAKACESQANDLQQRQKDAKYKGPNIASLYASEMSLRNKVLLLNTSAVGRELSKNTQAQNQLSKAIKTANNAKKTIATVKKALQFTADLIALAGGVVSDNPAAIIGSAGKLIADVVAKDDSSSTA